MKDSANVCASGKTAELSIGSNLSKRIPLIRCSGIRTNRAEESETAWRIYDEFRAVEMGNDAEGEERWELVSRSEHSKAFRWSVTCW